MKTFIAVTSIFFMLMASVAVADYDPETDRHQWAGVMGLVLN